MKRLLGLLLLSVILVTTGCEKETLSEQKKEVAEEVKKELLEEIKQEQSEQEKPETEEEKTPVDETEKRKISKSEMLSMSNDMSILQDEKSEITNPKTPDRIVLATSAEEKNGEMQWEDSQYWCLAVITDSNSDGQIDGAYNLFCGDMIGHARMEITKTPSRETVITLYVIDDGGKETKRQYTYDGEFFVETVFA